MAIVGLFTDLGISKTIDASLDAGFYIEPIKFGVSRDAGTLATSRTAANAGEWFQGAISSTVVINSNTVKVICTITPGQTAVVEDIKEVYLYANDSIPTQFLLALGQPTENIIYDPAGTITLELQISIVDIDLTANYLFTNTIATELSEHNTDPNAHPEIVDALAKGGQFLPAGAYPFAHTGQFWQEEVEFDGTKATETAGGVTFTSLFNGTEGNSVSLVFDGIDDVDTVVNDWNIANPDNMVGHDGVGTEVLTSQTVNLSTGTYVVADTDIVYRDTDGVYKQAIADGSIKTKAVAMADRAKRRVVFTGMLDYDTSSFAVGDVLFLSSSQLGKFATLNNGVSLGVVLVADANGEVLFTGFDGSATTQISNTFDAVVSTATGLNIFATTQEAINAVATNSRILVNRLEDIETTLDTIGKTLEFVIRDKAKGWRKFAGEAASFKVDFDVIPDAGTWRIEWNGQTTIDMPFNYLAAQVEAEFNLLAGHTGVTVTGDYNVGFTFTFADEEAQPVATFLDPGLNEIQRYNFSNVPDNGTITWTHKGDTTLNFPWDDDATDLETALEAIASITSVSVTGSFASQFFEVEFDGGVLQDGLQPQPDMQVTALTLAQGVTPTQVNGSVTPNIDPVIVQQGRYKANNLRNTGSDVVITVAQLSAGKPVGPDTCIILDAPQTKITGNGVIEDFETGVKLNNQNGTIVDVEFINTTLPIDSGDKLPGLDMVADDVLGYAKDVIAQLRLLPHPTDPKRVKISASDVVLPSGITLFKELSNFTMDFDGAEIDFDDGSIYKADGTTPLGDNFTPPAITASEWRWFSVAIIPGVTTSDNKIVGKVRVLAASADGVTKTLAPKPIYNGGTPLGKVAVQGTFTLPEISQLITRRDVEGDLDAKTFIVYDNAGSVAFWYDVDDSGTTAPAEALAANRNVEITTVNEDDNADTVATKTQAVVNGDSQFTATVVSSNRLQVTGVFQGAVSDVEVSTSGFSVSVIQQGKDLEAEGVEDILSTDIEQNTGGGGGGFFATTLPTLVEGIEAGEDILGVTNGPKAVFAKIKKVFEIDATNDQLDWKEGLTTYAAVLDHARYVYPYTALKADIEAKMLAQSGSTFTYNEAEWHHFISIAAGDFELLASATDSFWAAAGFGTSDLPAQDRHDAANFHAFTRVPMLFKTNTTNDGAPPYIDDGTFLNNVPADWRSRRVAGFISSDVLEGSVDTAVIRFGTQAFTSLTDGADYFTNGTDGEISVASVANSTLMGSAENNKLEMESLSFKLEPDTDVEPDSIIPAGLTDWEESPEVPAYAADHVAMHSCGFDGDNGVAVHDTVNSLGNIQVSFTTDKGKSWKEVELNPTNPPGFPDTRQSGSWNQTTDYLVNSPTVIVEGNRVFISYYVNLDAPSRSVIKGLYGTIDASGGLELRTSNEYAAGAFNLVISRTDHADSQVASKTEHRNGLIYVTWIDGSNGKIKTTVSHDWGASFLTYTADERNVKNGATVVEQLHAAANDVSVYQMTVTDVPGQSVTPSELILNGDFGTGDLTNWSDADSVGSGTVVVNGSNQVQVNFNLTNYGRLTQAITTVVGKSYRITYDIVEDDFDEVVVFPSSTAAPGSPIGGFMFTTGVGTGKSLVFTATGTTTYITLDVRTLLNVGSYTLDNFSCEEVIQNRLSVVTGSLAAGGPGSGYRGLFYTDDTDMTANWATAIDLGTLLDVAAATNHLPIGAHLDRATDKWYIHSIAGHNTGDGAGSLGRTGDTNFSGVTELDLSLATPTKPNETKINYGAQTTYTYNGIDIANSNGMNYLGSPANIIKTADGIMVSIVLVGLAGVVGYVSNDFVTTEFVDSDEHDASINILYAGDMQFGTTGTDHQLIQKLQDGALANASINGKVVGSSLTLDTSAKAETVLTPDFATDTNWTKVGGATIAAGVANIPTNADNVNQSVALVQGLRYRINYDITAHTGAGADLYIDGVLKQSGIPTGSYSYTFTPKSAGANFGLTCGVGASASWDNFSVQEATVQVSELKDIIEKPNADEQGVAKWVKVVSDPDNAIIHAMAVKDLSFEDVVDKENVVSNNFGSKPVNVVNSFLPFPVETKDQQAADSIVYDCQFDPLFPDFGVRCGCPTGVGATYLIETTVDGGKTWKKISHSITNGTLSFAGSSAYFEFSPAIAIVNKRAHIAICTGAGGNNEIHEVHGDIQANGDLSLAYANSGAAVLFAASGSIRQPRIAARNGQIFITGKNQTTFFIGIVESSDSGVNYGDGVTPGVTGGVKNVGALTVSIPDSAYTLDLIDDPDNPGDNRIMVVSADQTTGPVDIYYLDYTGANNLTSNWETRVSVMATGGTHDAIIGNGINHEFGETKMVVMTVPANNQNRLDLSTVNIGTTLITSENTAQDISPGGEAIDMYNGVSSTATSGNRHTMSLDKIHWTSAQSLHLSFGTDGGVTPASQLYHCKVSDVNGASGPTTNLQRQKIINGSVSFTATESQNGGLNDNYFCIFKANDDTAVNALTGGILCAVRVFDPTPTVNVAPTLPPVETVLNAEAIKRLALVSGDTSTSVYRGKPRVQSLSDRITVSYQGDNAKGFEGNFVNVYLERQINKKVEQWAQIPQRITSHAADLSTWDGDQIDDVAILATQDSSDTNMQVYASNDAWETKTLLTSVAAGGPPPNNSGNWVEFSPVARLIDADTMFVGFLGNSATNFKGLVGTRDSDGNWTVAASTTDPILGNGGNIMSNIRYAQRSGKLYVLCRDRTTNNLYVRVSSDNGDNWGTQQTVQDNVTAVVTHPNTPHELLVVDNGAGGDRIIVLARLNTGDVPHCMFYSNDDGANWQNRIDLFTVAGGGTGMGMNGYALDGTKLAVTGSRTDGDTGTDQELYLTTCVNIETAGTPVFTAFTNITDSLSPSPIGNIDKYGGEDTINNNNFHYIHNLHRIKWTGASSLMVVYERLNDESTPSMDALLVFIDNVAAVSPVQKLIRKGGTGASFDTQSQESQFITGPSGRIDVISKMTNSLSNNELRGRVFARTIDVANKTMTPEEDIGNKKDMVVGGFIGHFKVRPERNVLFLEKEDGSAIEQVVATGLLLK